MVGDQVLHNVGSEVSLFGSKLGAVAPKVNKLTFTVHCGHIDMRAFTIDLGKCREQGCLTQKSLMESMEEVIA